MLTLLLPVDGSSYSLKAVDYAIARATDSKRQVRVHLVTVQAPIATVNVKLFVSQESLETYYREEGSKALEESLARLRAANIDVEPHITVGDAARLIVDFALEKSAEEIIMGSHGRGALSSAVMGSVAQKVVHLALVPVVLIK